RRLRNLRHELALLGTVILLTQITFGVAFAAGARQGVRTLYLVRHGIYDQDDPRDEFTGKGLLPLGREQAQKVAQRLAAMPSGVDAVYSSDMTRARETAEIIAAALPGRAVHLEPGLRECTPPTPRADIMKDLRPGEADSCAARLDQTVARFFAPSPEADSSVVLVCHGNLIRYCVCRALGADPRLWLSMAIVHCSLTVIQVRPDGTTRLVAFDDVGHLPPDLQTFGPQARMFPGPPRKR
ncbi:MAG TPA: histidine phosphatase family protein, partial [Candidatus Saccharimonadales bacterium]|nr:histidine phosphatase family protein [Candidatus Saccharimonadales bacterium]